MYRQERSARATSLVRAGAGAAGAGAAVLIACLALAPASRADTPPRAGVYPFDIDLVSTRGETQLVTVTNTGGSMLTGIGFNVDGPTGGSVTAGAGSTCAGAQLAPQASCSLSLVWRPDTGRLGRWMSSLEIASNAGTVGIPMKLLALRSASFRTDPASASLDDVAVGSTSPGRRITIRSDVARASTLGQATIDGPGGHYFQVLDDGCSRTSLAARGSCTLTVTAIVPDDSPLGLVTAELEVPSRSNTESSSTALAATVRPPSGVSVDPSAPSFGGTPVGATGTDRVTIADRAGAAPLRLGSLLVSGGHADRFSITQDDCSGQIVAAGESCTLRVGFSPRDYSDQTTYLQVPTDRDGGRNFFMRLSGSGYAGRPSRITHATTSSSVVRWCRGCAYPDIALRLRLNEPANVRLLLRARSGGRWRPVGISSVRGHDWPGRFRIAGRWDGELLPARTVQLLVQLRHGHRWQTGRILALTVRSPFSTRILRGHGGISVHLPGH